MRNCSHLIFLFVSLAAVAMVTTGCPIGIGHPLGQPGKEKIDKNLLGTWTATLDSAEIQQVKVTKKNDFTYEVEVLEKGESYMMDGVAFDSWTTQLEGKTFLYSRPTEPEEDSYYVYHYFFEGKKLVIQDVSLLVGGLDAVTSTETFRAEVAASLKEPNCLTSRIEYIKQ